MDSTQNGLKPDKPAILLPDFRMSLERDMFYPGETIKGTLFYNVGEPTKIRGVHVQFDGYTYTRYRTQRVTYVTQITFFNPVATVFGLPRNSNDSITITTGSYTWPFQFTLPMGIPPSFTGMIGQICYDIKANVEIPFPFFDKRIFQPITLLTQYQSTLPGPAVLMAPKTTDRFFGLVGGEAVKIVAATQDVAFVGEDKQIQVDITNNSDKEVKSLTVKMTAHTTFFSKINTAFVLFGGPNLATTVQNDVISVTAGNSDFPIKPHSSWKGNICVRIPAGIAPTINPQTSPIIHHKYILKVAATTTGSIFTESSSETEFEIAIGVRNPFPYAPPKACTGTPYTIQVAQQQQDAQPQVPLVGVFNNDFSTQYSPMPVSAFQNMYNPTQQFEEGENVGENWGVMLAAGKTPLGYGQVLAVSAPKEVTPAMQIMQQAMPPGVMHQVMQQGIPPVMPQQQAPQGAPVPQMYIPAANSSMTQGGIQGGSADMTVLTPVYLTPTISKQSDNNNNQ